MPLNLGNLANKVTPAVSPTASQDVARSQNIANSLALAADTLSGKNYVPGQSGFEQALGAGLRGAAQGMQGKATMTAAKGQDEYNAYVQQMADFEANTTKVKDRIEREQNAQKKYASIIASAVVGANGDPEKLKAMLPMYYKMLAKESGYDVVSITPQGDNPYLYSATLKDPEDGETSTQDVTPVEVMQYVFEQDPELAKQAIAAMGQFDPSLLSKGKTSALADKITETEQALGRSLTEQERLDILGITQNNPKPEVSDYQKELDKKTAVTDSKVLEALPQLQSVAFSADRVIDELARTGIQTGPLSQLKAELLGGINSITGVDIFGSPETIQTLDALQAPQVFAAVRNLGAGTGISNADREFAAKTIGGSLTDPKVIARMQALLKASAMRNGFFAKPLQAYASGKISREELEAFRTRIYGNVEGGGQAGQYSLNTLASKFEQEYLQKLTAGERSRLSPAQVESTQSSLVNQFGLDMGE